MIWGFKTWQFILLAIAFPILAAIGVVSLQALQDRNFQPQEIQQRTVDQRRVETKMLTPARKLVGRWRGQAKYIFHQTNISYCYLNYDVLLIITGQTGNTVAGNVTVTWLSSEQHGNFRCAPTPTTNDQVNGTLSSSRITINASRQGNFTGSFTTDTMTLNQPRAANADGLVGAIHLLRQ